MLLRGRKSFLAKILLAASICACTLAEGQTSPVALKVDTKKDYQIEQINKLVEQVWNDFDLKPSNDASDGEWCRRVFLDIIGRIPSVDELNKFLGNRSDDRKQKLVDMLLYDDLYTEEFARNWTTIWTNLLIG